MARDFTAANHDIQFTSITSQNSLTTITISAWIRPDSAGFDAGDPYGRIFQKSSRLAFYVDGDVSPTFGFSSGWSGSNGDWGADYGSLGSFGTLHHVAVTYDAGSAANKPTLYLNGSSQSLGAYDSNPTGTINSDTTGLSIGATNGGAGDYDGLIAEVGFWNRLLTQSEITALSKGFAPSLIKTGLVFYTPLIGRNSPEIDLVGGTSGTVGGAVTATHPRIIYPSEMRLGIPPAGSPPVTNTRRYSLPTLGVS